MAYKKPQGIDDRCSNEPTKCKVRVKSKKSNYYFCCKYLILCIGSLLLSSCSHNDGFYPHGEVRNLIERTMMPGGHKEVEDYVEWDRCPGWMEPDNKAALLKYIRDHPNTEDCYLAMVALDLVENHSPGFNKSKLAANRASRLNDVLVHAHNPLIRKWANIARVGDLLYAGDLEGQQKQTQDILQNIEDYKSEKNPYFIRYLAILDETPETLEPTLRELLVMGECNHGHLEKALTMAEELRSKFPDFDSHSIEGNIEALKAGQNPYPM